MDTNNNLDLELSRTSSSTSLFLPRPIPSTSLPIVRTILGNKLDHLFEITTIPNEQKSLETDLPLINPYHPFTKNLVTTIRSIKTFIKQIVRTVKEYIQALGFDQHPIPFTFQEQFMTLQIPYEFSHQ